MLVMYVSEETIYMLYAVHNSLKLMLLQILYLNCNSIQNNDSFSGVHLSRLYERPIWVS